MVEGVIVRLVVVVAPRATVALVGDKESVKSGVGAVMVMVRGGVEVEAEKVAAPP